LTWKLEVDPEVTYITWPTTSDLVSYDLAAVQNAGEDEAD